VKKDIDLEVIKLTIFVSQPHFKIAVQLKNAALIGISDNLKAPYARKLSTLS